MSQKLPLSKFLPTLIFISLLSSIGLSVPNVSAADAYEYYSNPNGYSKCVSDSGRSNIYSVTNYACKKAAAKAQNACASWIGPADNSASNIIDAGTATSGEIQVKIWGMCTYYENTSSMMAVSGDNGSITTCAGSNIACNFNRTGNWGEANIGSKTVNLDIAKFIEHAPVVVINGETYYYRVVILKRQHGGNTSRDVDFSYIYLKAGGTPTPVPVLGTCNSVDWPNPPSYTSSNEKEGSTSVDIRIRNTADRFGGIGYGNWNDGTIFAMPTDQIAWHTCYYPGVQTTARTEVSKINGGWQGYKEPLSTTSCEPDEHVEFKPLKDVASVWENKLIGEGINNVTQNFSPPENHTDVKERDDSYTTTVDDVGNTYTETSKTGSPTHAVIENPPTPTADYNDDYCKTCHGSKNESEDECECTDGLSGYTGCDDEGNNCHCGCYGLCCTNKYDTDKFSTATVDYSTASDSASVKIPYNYQKRTGVNIYDDIVYAGESTKIKEVWTMVIPRWNSQTLAAYATKTKDASKIKLYAYVTPNSSGDKESFETTDGNGCGVIRTTDKQCVELDSTSKTLNDSGKLEGDEDQLFENHDYNVFDASAGDYMCFVSSVNKEASSGDEDMEDNGNGKWAYSEPACAVIAKRPSFEVWGGDMYSNSKIDAKPAEKRNVYNAYKGDINNKFIKRDNPGETIYGSWVEEALVLGNDGLGHSGSTTNLASGAATGYNNTAEKAYAGNSGDFCNNRSPLTIANYHNDNCEVGDSGLTLYPDNDARRKLIDYWIKDSSDAGTTPSGATIEYDNTSTTISGRIPVRTTKILDVNGTVTITGDITYNSGYTTLRDIPKLIIYADNVDILCSVNEVDAIIITKTGGTVNTCSNASNSDSDPARSNQLKIFGMVITDNIKLGRTYGQAAWKGGSESEGRSAANGQREAAEIFDFDSSILLWSEFMASSAETDTLQVVYQVEIAPRY